MKIGLDYGGVISSDPKWWADAIREVISTSYDNMFYIVSHAISERDAQSRIQFCEEINDSKRCVNLTFWDIDELAEEKIIQRKIELCKQHQIQIIVEDSFNRGSRIAKECGCALLYVPQKTWWIGKTLIEGL